MTLSVWYSDAQQNVADGGGNVEQTTHNGTRKETGGTKRPSERGTNERETRQTESKAGRALHKRTGNEATAGKNKYN